jgi:hypothetical protein
MEATYAYLAGVIDADGHITIVRSVRSTAAGPRTYYTVRIGITGTRPAPHELAKDTNGGSLRCNTPTNPAHRPVYVWDAGSRIAETALRHLEPHLRVKQVQARAALSFLDLCTAQQATLHATTVPPYRITDDMMAERERWWQAVTEANEPRNRRVHFPSPQATA